MDAKNNTWSVRLSTLTFISNSSMDSISMKVEVVVAVVECVVDCIGVVEMDKQVHPRQSQPNNFSKSAHVFCFFSFTQWSHVWPLHEAAQADPTVFAQTREDGPLHHVLSTAVQ